MKTCTTVPARALVRAHAVFILLTAAILMAGCAHTDTVPRNSLRVIPNDFATTPQIGNSLLGIATIDVGQGFCILILCPSPSKPILYDCGSSGATIMGPHQKDYARQLIKNAILASNAYNPQTKTATLGALIVSHSDMDHYNWLPDVAPLSGMPNEGVTFAFERVLYSGSLADYTENTYVQQVAATPNVVNVLPTPGNEYHTGRIFGEPAPLPNGVWPTETRLECGNPALNQYATVLSVNAINPKKPADSNPKSVVLRIQNGSNSVIISGDAEVDTYNAIYSAYELTSLPTMANPAGGFDSPALHTTLLLAPHHGAITNGSADGQWAYLVNPQTVVFSAGLRMKYFHPQCATLAAYVNNPGPPYVHNNTDWRLAMSKQIADWCGSSMPCAQFYSTRANYATALYPIGRSLPLCCGAFEQSAYTTIGVTQAAFSTWVNGSVTTLIPPSGPPRFFCPDAMNGTGDCSLPRVQFTEGVQCIRP